MDSGILKIIFDSGKWSVLVFDYYETTTDAGILAPQEN